MTVTNGGDTIIAAMEGALSGDTDATLHRFLTYNKDRRGHWALVKQRRHHTPALDWQRRRGFRMTRKPTRTVDYLIQSLTGNRRRRPVVAAHLTSLTAPVDAAALAAAARRAR